MKTEQLMKFGRRIKEVRKSLGIKQQDFARLIQVSNSFLSEVESGKAKAGFNIFYYISKTYNVNLDYLLHGAGPMFYSEEDELTITKADLGEYGDRILEMLEYFETSPIVKLAVLEFYIRYLYENEDVIKKDINESRKKREKIAEMGKVEP